MSVGLPVVTTPVGCLSAIVEDGRNGVVVPVADRSALAGALTSLLGDEQRWRAIADHARNTINERFGWRTVTEAVQRRYDAASAATRAGRRAMSAV
jgi:glycosyltransferase involved in cell wall biosynthesis